MPTPTRVFQGRTKPKQGVENSIQASHVYGRHVSAWAVMCCSPRSTLAGGWIKSGIARWCTRHCDVECEPPVRWLTLSPPLLYIMPFILALLPRLGALAQCRSMISFTLLSKMEGIFCFTIRDNNWYCALFCRHTFVRSRKTLSVLNFFEFLVLNKDFFLSFVYLLL